MARGFGNYDRWPSIAVDDHQAWTGPEAIGRLAAGLPAGGVIIIDCYPGTDVPTLMAQIRGALPDAVIINVEDAARPSDELDRMLAPYLTDDRVFGQLAHLPLNDFYDQDRLQQVRTGVDRHAGSLLFLVGWGASLVDVRPDVLVLADMARWEIQQRQRRGGSNWHADNGSEDQLRKNKRGYFVEWRTADDHKRAIWDRADYWLDTNDAALPKLVRAEAVREGLAAAVRRPFRVVPYFDPGTWGGQWMREVCGLDDGPANFAWCFDCVPEENSLLLDVSGTMIEIPAQNLVFRHPEALLGPRTHARFGPEFPIRFDMLDTMGGGNLSLQVHPLTGYIQNTFGMHYTQDESYYLLDADPGTQVYLGLRTGVDPEEMIKELRRAERGESAFPADRFVNTFPAKKHDHFSIPAGTVHCSGADSMVLEISATPYIFTFKMWDWGRLGLDGKPRPINIDHAAANIQWQRDTEWTRQNLVARTVPVDSGVGWRQERTGLHPLEFIETRRHWITGTAEHDTRGTVNVKNLVEGAEAVVESPDGAFEPFVVHYAETFIVPAAVGRYTVRPYGAADGTEIATITASVRDTEYSSV